MSLPFRSQPQPSLPEPEELAALPPGPCRAVAVRSCMTPGVTSLVAAPHASLGLQAYVQVTSPIRRYADLLAHRQIKAHLRSQKPPLGDGELLRRVETAGAMAKEAQRVSRECERYWVILWFSRHPKGTAHSGARAPLAGVFCAFCGRVRPGGAKWG